MKGKKYKKHNSAHLCCMCCFAAWSMAAMSTADGFGLRSPCNIQIKDDHLSVNISVPGPSCFGRIRISILVLRIRIRIVLFSWIHPEGSGSSFRVGSGSASKSWSLGGPRTLTMEMWRLKRNSRGSVNKWSKHFDEERNPDPDSYQR
jgi:hypothetical protein